MISLGHGAGSDGPHSPTGIAGWLPEGTNPRTPRHWLQSEVDSFSLCNEGAHRLGWGRCHLFPRVLSALSPVNRIYAMKQPQTIQMGKRRGKVWRVGEDRGRSNLLLLSEKADTQAAARPCDLQFVCGHRSRSAGKRIPIGRYMEKLRQSSPGPHQSSQIPFQGRLAFPDPILCSLHPTPSLGPETWGSQVGLVTCNNACRRYSRYGLMMSARSTRSSGRAWPSCQDMLSTSTAIL